MNLSDLRPCDACGEPHRTPIFYHVQVEQHVMDANAVNTRLGLEMMFGGNGKLADVFCPHGDRGTTVSSAQTLILCVECFCRSGQVTLAQDKRAKEEDA